MCWLMSPLQTQWANRKPKQSISSWAESEGASSSVMSHPAWLALSPPRNRCGSIFTKRACEEQTPTLLHSRLWSHKARPLLHSCGQTMDHTGEQIRMLTLCGPDSYLGGDSHSLGRGAVHGVGSSSRPSSPSCYGLSSTTVCTEPRKSNRVSEPALGSKTQPKLYFYRITLPAVFY